MKAILILLTSLWLCLPNANAQFPPLPAADLVLGAADFDTPGDAEATATGLSDPRGIAIDPTSGAVFVSDNGRNRVLRFPNMNALTSGAAAEAVFGQTLLSQSDAGLSSTGLQSPSGIHVDSSGRLWVADSGHDRVLMYQNASGLGSGAAANLVLGQPDFVSASPGKSANGMSAPSGVFIDSNDNLWVADQGNNRVLKFASASTLTTGTASATVVLGQPDFGFDGAGTTAALMGVPRAVIVDAFDTLWVGDSVNHRVLRFSNASLLTNGASADGVLGQDDFVSKVPQTDASSFSQPKSLAMDPNGTLWVSDTDNNRVIVFKNARLKSNGASADSVIGQPDLTTSTAGVSARKLNAPNALVIDPAGRLWVCDSDNDRLLRFSPDTVRPLLTVKKVPRKTSKARLKIKGTATDASGIASVRYRTGKGAYKAARGMASWNFSAKLKPGLNKLEIQATDAAGNVSASKKLKVRRG